MRPENKVKLDEIEREINTWRISQLEELLEIVETLIKARQADEEAGEDG